MADPDTKRRRVRLACDTCRAKKAKCDGTQPSCSTCQRNNIKCTYPPSKKRGVKTGYIHELEMKVMTLEAILGFMLMSKQNEQEIVKLSLSAKLAANLAAYQREWNDKGHYRAINDFITEVESNQGQNPGIPGLFEAEKSGSVGVGLEQETSNNAENKWKLKSLQYLGLSGLVSGFSPEALESYTQLLGSHSSFRVASIFHVKSESSSSSKVLRSIPRFPEDTRVLIDIYFRVVHPYFPMLNRIHLIRYAHTNAETSRSNTAQDYNTMALTWTILANGQYAKDVTNQEVDHLKSKQYAHNAIKALELAGDSTIETIQSMLLLGHYEYCIGEWDKAWVLTLSAARMAIDVRLMELPQELGDPLNLFSAAQLKTSRERTWSVAFLLNTLLSARMGRSPVIRALDWPEVRIEEDGWEEWDSWTDYRGDSNALEAPLHLETARSLSTLNCVLAIVSVLNITITSTIDVVGISDTLFTPNFVTLEYLENKLTSLKEAAPDHCKIDPQGIGKIAPFVVFVELVYNLVLCVVALKLSDVEAQEGYKYSRERRNSIFQSGIARLTNALTHLEPSQVIRVPYVDYFMTINYNSPLTLNLLHPPAQSVMHLIQKYATILPNCKISYDILTKYTQPVTLRDASMLMTPSESTKTQTESLEPLLGGMNGFTGANSNTTKLNYKRSDFSPAAGVSPGFYKLFESKQSPINIQGTPGATGAGGSKTISENIFGPSEDHINELEAFMLDANEDGPRQGKFLKNLGFVGLPKEWNRDK